MSPWLRPRGGGCRRLSVLALVDKGDAGGEAVLLEAGGQAVLLEAIGEAALLEAGGEAVLLEAIGEAALLEAIGEVESSVNVKDSRGWQVESPTFAQRVEARVARHYLLKAHALMQALWELELSKDIAARSHGARTRCVR